MLPTPVTVREDRANSSVLSNQSLELPGDWDGVQSKVTSEFVLPVGTHWVERDVLGVSEEIEAMTGGQCRVASCQCGKCELEGHFPHVVVEHGRRGGTFPVFGFHKFGPHVIQRMQEIHVSNNPNKKAMEANKKRRQEIEAQAEAIQREKLDIVHSALSSTRFDWKGPNGIRTKAY